MSSPGSPRRRGRPDPRLTEAVDARAALQEQFYRVDQLQRDIGGTVRQYAALLPDRASATGVVPGFAVLDQQADELVVAYLGLLDTFDPVEEAPPHALAQAVPQFRRLTHDLGRLADDLDGFLDRFGVELGRVGQVRADVQHRVSAATAVLAQAEQAWRRAGEAGLSFPAADEALARASVAARKLAELEPRLTPATVEEPAATVERLASEALRLATELPERAASLGTRLTSLRTRIDAVEHRAGGVPETMRALRREFALATWEDLADRERDVPEALEDARVRLREVGRLRDAGDLPGALAQLELLEEALASAEDVVDGPRDRLEHLRAVRADPESLLARARFRLRDAKFLLQRGGPVIAQPWAGRLDAAALELERTADLLTAPHPDYLALARRVDEVEERVQQLVDDFRGR